MADKRYVVLDGKKYVGKHRTYTSGQDFPESELFGNEENKRMALEGAKDKKNDKGVLLIKGKAAVIKPLANASRKEAKK